LLEVLRGAEYMNARELDAAIWKLASEAAHIEEHTVRTANLIAELRKEIQRSRNSGCLSEETRQTRQKRYWDRNVPRVFLFEDSLYELAFGEKRNLDEFPEPADIAESVKYILSGFSDRTQQIIKWRLLENKSIQEIAYKCGISEEAVSGAIMTVSFELRHGESADILRYGLSICADRNSKAQEAETKMKTTDMQREAKSEKEDIPLEDFGLSVRARNCLMRAGANTVKDVESLYKRGNLLKLRNIGAKTYMEIIEKLGILDTEN
jgi:hypothetical protein